MSSTVSNYYNLSNLWKSKTYEEWVDDFIIDIMIYTHEPEYYKVKYVDACNVNKMICPAYNTYSMYYNYLRYHNYKVMVYVFLFALFLFVSAMCLYKFSRVVFFTLTAICYCYINL